MVLSGFKGNLRCLPNAIASVSFATRQYLLTQKRDFWLALSHVFPVGILCKLLNICTPPLLPARAVSRNAYGPVGISGLLVCCDLLPTYCGAKRICVDLHQIVSTGFDAKAWRYAFSTRRSFVDFYQRTHAHRLIINQKSVCRPRGEQTRFHRRD